MRTAAAPSTQLLAQDYAEVLAALQACSDSKGSERRTAVRMDVQAKISRAKLKAKIGRTLKVLVDAPGVGRSMADAPEIDGVVKFKGGKTGEFVNIRIERSDAHDLHGRMA